MRPSIAKALLILAGLLAGAVIFIIPVEIYLRYHWKEPMVSGADLQYRYLDIYDRFFRLRWQDHKPVYVAQRPRAKPASFPLFKDRRTRRVFIVGESIALIYPEEGLKKALEKALPSERFEVINCGMGGYSSHPIALVGNEIINYSPDLVILMAGNNVYYGLDAINPYRYKGILSGLRVYRRLTDYLYPEINFPKEQKEIRFAQNIAGFLRKCAQRRIPVVVCTLPVNFKDFAPNPGMALYGNREYVAARLLLDKKEFGKAEQRFLSLVKDQPNEPDLHYYLAKTYEAQNKFREARDEYLVAAGMTDWPRCTPERNRLLRRLAAENNAILADVEQQFLDLSPRGLLGFELFEDNCHVYPPGYEVFSYAILKAVHEHNKDKGAAVLAPSDRWHGEVIERPAYSEFYSRGQEYRFKFGAKQSLCQAVCALFSLPEDHFAGFVCSYLQEMYYRDPSLFKQLAGSGQLCHDIVASNSWSRSQAAAVYTRWPDLLFYAGETCRGMRRYDLALSYFNEAIKRDMTRWHYFLFRGLTYYQAREHEKARQDFEKVMNMNPAFKWLPAFIKEEAA